MLKFLRKYNKYILVIGGALLMVAFLVPQALTQLGQDRSGREYMRIDGQKITEGEAFKADRRRYVLAHTIPAILPTLGIEDRTDHWLLLVHEADRHGLIGGPQDGRDFIPDLADYLAYVMLQQQYGPSVQMLLQSQFGEQMLSSARQTAMAHLEAARARSEIGTEEFDLALAELHGISRLRRLYDGGPSRISDRRAILEGLRMHNAATVDYVLVPAEAAIDQVPVPSDETLAAHLERFKDVRPSEGEYGIGYLLPPRVKLEWLVLDRAAISQAVRVDRIEVAERFMTRNPGLQASGPEYEAVRAEIEEELRKEATDRIMAEADQAIRAEFARAIRRLPTQGVYRVLPENWDEVRPSLESVRDAVVERVRSQTGRTIAAPTVTVMNATWHTAQDLSRLPGIGFSSIRRAGRNIGFPTAAMSVKELGDPLDLGFQVGVPGAMTTDPAGNQYYFTILDARPESPPASVDEIRDQLVQDYRRLEAFKILQREADIYRQRVLNEGLDSLAAAVEPAEGAPPPQVRRGVSVTRTNNVFGDPALNEESVKEAIVSAAEKLDPTVDASTIDADQRTLAVPAPKTLGLVVAQIQAFRPMTIESYRLMDRSLVQQMEAESAMTSDDDPFSVEKLAKRLNAKLPPQRGDSPS